MAMQPNYEARDHFIRWMMDATFRPSELILAKRQSALIEANSAKHGNNQHLLQFCGTYYAHHEAQNKRPPRVINTLHPSLRPSWRQLRRDWDDLTREQALVRQYFSQVTRVFSHALDLLECVPDALSNDASLALLDWEDGPKASQETLTQFHADYKDGYQLLLMRLGRNLLEAA